MIEIFGVAYTYRELFFTVLAVGFVIWLAFIGTRAEDSIKRKKHAILEDEYRKRFDD
ncbi:hypothetical protein ACVR05_04160 [Streptococcus caprae]|uniref:Heme exporter protein D n=1 Tax=Streptococcus caprae TaxID=1640501 RepID=A0ABV8CZD1_9STRE